MSFNSFEFLFVFLPITLIIYWLCVKKGYAVWGLRFLVAASVLFYAVEYPLGAVILLFSLGINYLFLKNIFKNEKSKMTLTAGIIFNLLLLCADKYLPLLIEGFHLSLPGISFYTFFEIALLVEAYRRTIKQVGFLDYSFWMTFFPKLLQGPILIPNIKDNNPYPNAAKGIDSEKIYRGIMLFALGLFKKVIIADTLGKAVAYGYSNPNAIHTGEALIVTVSYTFQLYFDFSGYCDMGMAVASFFGIDLPLNFNSPFKSKSIEEFWRRWHITLTDFFTRYIYIPLGGNRKGELRTYFNIFAIFVVSALWHGVGWTYLIWGLLHAGMCIINRLCRTKLPKRESKKSILTAVTDGVKVMFTFAYFTFTVIYFGASSVGAANRMLQSFGEWWFPRLSKGLAECFNIDELWYIIKVLKLDTWEYGIYILVVIFFVLMFLFAFILPNSVEYSKKCKINIANTILIIVLLAWSVLSLNGVSTFIYANF